MKQIASVWSKLDTRRRVVVVAATAAMFLAILGLSRIATDTSMALLYAGLEPQAAGEVVGALEQRGVAHQIRGSAIFVEAARRDELRMTLASEGLPMNGSKGYELLDSLSGFGTTSQMFDAAYWRAKEGELARTIVASPNIKAARVHIASTGTTPFRRQVEPTASVTVTTAGESLSSEHARALRYLVASAVAGLDAADVSIIDGRNGVVMTVEDATSPAAGNDRAEALKHNVERLLEAWVGPGNAVVEVAVETVTDREQIVERRFDPEGRVAISTEVEESSSRSQDQGQGVTVASNLPDGDAAEDAGTSSSQNTESRQRTNFEVSETQREVFRTPGAIKRISVAVLVDGIEDASGAWQPRSEGEVEALRELVASAVGFDEARGDAITIKSMEFQPMAEQGTAAGGSFADRLVFDLMSAIQLAVLTLVVLALGLFVVRPVLLSRRQEQEVAALAPPESRAAADLLALTSADTGTDGRAVGLPAPANVVGELTGPAADTSDAVARLRRLIEERQDETVGVLRKWMEDRPEKA